METKASGYEIKTYSEDVLEAQYQIGLKEQQKRTLWTMTSVDNLKKAYEGEKFDPETKFYAYKDDQIVGFVTAAIQDPNDDGETIANMEFPIALEEHENVKVQLMDHAISVLRSKGVQKVKTRVTQFWPGTTELSEKYGYKFSSDISKRGSLSIVGKDTTAIPEEIKDINLEDPLLTDRIVDYYVEQFKASEESIRGQFEGIKSNPEPIISLNYYEKDGEIRSVTALSRQGSNPKAAAFAAITASGDNPEEIEREMFNNQIYRAQKAGVEELDLFLFGPALQNEEKFVELGFNFKTALSLHEKEL